MGLANWWRFAKGSNARLFTKAVGMALAQKIPDRDRDRAERVAIETLAHIVSAGETRTRAALKELVALGELERSHRTGAKDSYQILWGALNPPDETEPDHEHDDYKARHPSGAPVSPESDAVRGSVRPGTASKRVTRVREARRTGAGSASPVRTLKGSKAVKGAAPSAGRRLAPPAASSPERSDLPDLERYHYIDGTTWITSRIGGVYGCTCPNGATCQEAVDWIAEDKPRRPVGDSGE